MAESARHLIFRIDFTSGSNNHGVESITLLSVVATYGGLATVVHVFDLNGNPNATRAYAWSSRIKGSTKRRFFAVLHTGKINSPLQAVRAAIVAEHRSHQ